MATTFPGAVNADFEVKLGCLLADLRDWGAKSDSGVSDNTTVIQRAVNEIGSNINGGNLFVPPSSGYFGCLDIDIPSNVRIVGRGYSSSIQRIGNLPANRAILNFTGVSNAGFSQIRIDGHVTTPVGLIFSDFASDPMHTILVQNSSVRINAGCDGIEIEDSFIEHTGGYSILVNATTGNVSRIKIRKNLFKNNRPHLLGILTGDRNYGSWTGGIHYQTDGTLYIIDDMEVHDNKFERMTGAGCWGHAYALAKQSTRISIQNNKCKDVAYHNLQLGNVDGATFTDNHSRRAGYVTLTDSDTPVPKYLSGAQCSAFDMSGLVKNAIIRGNAAKSPNGQAFDLDGLALSIVEGNSASIPFVGEPEYSEDSINLIGPGGVGNNWTYGIQTGNTNLLDGGNGVIIRNNYLKNMGGGSLRLYTLRNGNVYDNKIILPTAPNYPPIVLGNTGTADTQRANNNIVKDNKVFGTIVADATYGTKAVVYEDSSLGAFNGTDKNWVINNGDETTQEFQKNANTQSVGRATFSTNVIYTGTPAISSHFVQRSGQAADSSSALQWYLQEGAVQWEHMQLQGYWKSGSRGPLLNVSEVGVGGAITTGGRTLLAFNDSMATGKSVVDSFVAISDTTYADADANLLGATWALLRFKSSVGFIQQSISVLAGARVWTAITAASTPAGADKQIQFNDTGVLAAQSNLIYDKTLKKVTLTGLTGTIGISALTSYIDSAEGFNTGSSAANAIQALSGGVTALALISARNDGDSGLILSRSTATARDWGFGVGSTGEFILRDRTAAANRLTIDTAGLISIGATVSLNQSGAISATGVISSTGASGGVNVITQNTYNAMQAANGGVYVRSVHAISYSFMGSSSGVPTATTGDSSFPANGAFFYDTATNKARLRQAGAWIDMVSTSATAGGADTNILYNKAGVIFADSSFSWNYTSKVVLVAGVAATAAINVTLGYIQSDGGYVVPNTASAPYNNTDVIQAKAGGVTARWLIATDSLFLISQAAPAASGSGQARFYMDNGTNKVRLSLNTGVYSDLLTVAAGVASLTGGTAISVSASVGAVTINNTGVTSAIGTANQVNVSAATGAVTFSLPQSIATSSAVTFGSVTTGTGGAFNSGATGANISFQNANTNFQVDGNGNISSAGSINVTGTNPYKVGGTTIVDSSRNATFVSVIATNTGASVTFKNNNNNFQVDGNGNVSAVAVISSTGASGGFNVTTSTAANSIQSAAGGIRSALGYQVGSTTVINSSGVYVGPAGINCGTTAGITGRAFNPYDGSAVLHTGQDGTLGVNTGTGKLTWNGTDATVGLKMVGGSFVGFA